MTYVVFRLRLADTYAEFIEIVERMWAQDPADRPPFDIILPELVDIFDKEINRGNDTNTTTGTAENTTSNDQLSEETESEEEAAGAAAMANRDTSSDSEEEEQPATSPNSPEFADSESQLLEDGSQAVLTPDASDARKAVLTPDAPDDESSQESLTPVSPAESKPPPVPKDANASSE